MVTERLLIDSDSAEENLKRLRVLRGFLQVVGKRWLGCSMSKTKKNNAGDV